MLWHKVIGAAGYNYIDIANTILDADAPDTSSLQYSEVELSLSEPRDFLLAIIIDDQSITGTNDSDFTTLFADTAFNGTSSQIISYAFGNLQTYQSNYGGVTRPSSHSQALYGINGVRGVSIGTGTRGSKTPPAVTAEAGDVVLTLLPYEDDASNIITAVPSGYTELDQQNSQSASDVASGWSIAYKEITTDGTETPGAFTTSIASSNIFYPQTILLKQYAA